MPGMTAKVSKTGCVKQGMWHTGKEFLAPHVVLGGVVVDDVLERAAVEDKLGCGDDGERNETA